MVSSPASYLRVITKEPKMLKAEDQIKKMAAADRRDADGGCRSPGAGEIRPARRAASWSAFRTASLRSWKTTAWCASSKPRWARRNPRAQPAPSRSSTASPTRPGTPKGKIVGPGKCNPLGTRWLGLSAEGLRHSRHERAVLDRPQRFARLHPDAQSRRGRAFQDGSGRRPGGTPRRAQCGTGAHLRNARRWWPAPVKRPDSEGDDHGQPFCIPV